jgi:Predicted dehydrogenases and related proteins
MKLGFIGLGAVIDTAYLPAIQRLNVPLANCFGFDVDKSRAPGGIVRCDSLEALLEKQPDMVFITTSSLWHLPVLEQVLRSPVPRIVVEKPVAATLTQLQQLQALLALPGNADRVLALDHWMAKDGVIQLARGMLENDWQPEADYPPLAAQVRRLDDIVKIEGYLLEPSGFNDKGEPVALNFATGEPDTRTLRHPDGVIVDIGTHVLAMMHETLAAAEANNQLALTLVEARDRLGNQIAQGDVTTAEGSAHLQGELCGIPLEMWLNKYAGPSGGQKGIRLHLRDGTVLSQDRRGAEEVLEIWHGEQVQRWKLKVPVYERCLQRYILGDGSLFIRAAEQISHLTQRRIAEVTALLEIQQQLRGPH